MHRLEEEKSISKQVREAKIIKLFKDPKLTIDVSNTRTENGDLTLRLVNESLKEPAFEIIQINDEGFFYIVHSATDLALTAEAQDPEHSPQNVLLLPFKKSPDQIWRIDPKDNESSKIICKSNQKVLCATYEKDNLKKLERLTLQDSVVDGLDLWQLCSVERSKEVIQKARFAYVTLVFGSSRFYIPPALVLGYSLQKFKNEDIDVVCMVTNDVSSTDRLLLNKYFDRVIEKPYLCKKTSPFFLKSLLRKNSFLDKLYTKWRCLELTEYEKVFFLDADMFAKKDPSKVFTFKAPGGVFLSGYSKRMGGKVHDYYDNSGDLKEGQIYKMTLDKDNHIPTGQAVLLKPSSDDFDKLQKLLNKKDEFQLSPFKSFSGDEVVLARLYPEWTFLGVEYCYSWSLNTCTKETYKLDKDFKPIIFTMQGPEKVWTKESAEWEDEKLWFEIAEKLPEFKDFASFR